jgi:hypothetical protein
VIVESTVCIKWWQSGLSSLTFFRNVEEFLPDYTASHPWIYYFSLSNSCRILIVILYVDKNVYKRINSRCLIFF